MPHLTRADLWELRLPLRTAVDWTVGGAEADVPYLLLLLEDDAGRRGVGEITCRPEWNGMTPGLLARAFVDIAWPRIVGLDLSTSAAQTLSGVRGAVALRALCDNAWRDLTSPVPTGAPVRVASVLTRGVPGDMAEAALKVRDDTGITAFKVKLGQGIARDGAVLAALRRSLGDVDLSGDANSAYAPEDLPDLFALASDMGLTFLEDPCPLLPDTATARACAGAPVPVLADKPIEGPDLLPAFAERGLVQVSAKPGRLGLTAAQAIASVVATQRGRICNGTYSESALGAAAQIAFAQGLPTGLAHPHEIDFHRHLSAQIAPLPEIRDGFAAPVCGRIADRLDLAALKRLGTGQIRLRHGAAARPARKTKDHAHG
ncbi:enolase C-terminal domain-like protein [Puniceibacterium sp. IMCC21224]|uniref:enolase C-terminal domain-like protein n=1 Tax=Puniceibacterium sp. IMCC21224 TaxID=1618204 RepID=UPI00064DB363|nr:enolase C-terminal domain-like protein [Puniceibacterium sp. IMCC21224]KMK65135.1 enolase superfamily enzyme [Puniceibacterium sp. IMCC21224]